LEREFKFFNVLEGVVCTMCAPRDQRKSRDNQREWLNRTNVGASGGLMFREGAISFGKPGPVEADLCKSSIRGMSSYGTVVPGGGRLSS
jgi:hypothetical protein